MQKKVLLILGLCLFVSLHLAKAQNTITNNNGLAYQDTFDLHFLDDYNDIKVEPGDPIYSLHSLYFKGELITSIDSQKIRFYSISSQLFLLYEDWQSFLIIGDTRSKELKLLLFWRSCDFEKMSVWSFGGYKILMIPDRDGQGFMRNSFISINESDFTMCSSSFMSKVRFHSPNDSELQADFTIRIDTIQPKFTAIIETVILEDVTPVDTLYGKNGNWYIKKQDRDTEFNRQFLRYILEFNKETGCLQQINPSYFEVVGDFVGINKEALSQLLMLKEY